MSDFIEQDDWLETTPLNKTSKKKSKSKHSKTKKKLSPKTPGKTILLAEDPRKNQNFLNGYFKVKLANQDVYEGEWKNDNMHGQGTMTYKNKDIYQGNWENGKRQGKGKLYISGRKIKPSHKTATQEREIYNGNWVNDKKHGKGEYIFSDYTKYIGDWENDNENGKGILEDENGNKIYDGQWKDGNKHGIGKLYYPNGNIRYEGTFKNDREYEGKLFIQNEEGINTKYIKGKFYNENLKEKITGNFEVYSLLENTSDYFLEFEGTLHKLGIKKEGTLYLGIDLDLWDITNDVKKFIKKNNIIDKKGTFNKGFNEDFFSIEDYNLENNDNDFIVYDGSVFNFDNNLGIIPFGKGTIRLFEFLNDKELKNYVNKQPDILSICQDATLRNSDIEYQFITSYFVSDSRENFVSDSRENDLGSTDFKSTFIHTCSNFIEINDLDYFIFPAIKYEFSNLQNKKENSIVEYSFSNKIGHPKYNSEKNVDVLGKYKGQEYYKYCLNGKKKYVKDIWFKIHKLNEKKVYCLKCIVNNDNKKCFICDKKIKQFEEFFKTIINASQDIIDEENSTIKDIDINCQVCWKPTDTKLDCDCKAHICSTCLTQAWSREYRGERPLNNKCPQCKKEGVKLIKANDEFVSMNHIIDLNYDDDKYNGQEKICLHVDCMQKLIEPALSRLNNLIYNSDDTSMDKSTSIENKKYDRSVRSMKLSQLTPIFLKNMKEFFQLKEISNEIEKTLNEVRDESDNMKNVDITINKFLQNKQENLKKLSRAEIKKVTESVPPLPDDATNFFFPNR